MCRKGWAGKHASYISVYVKRKKTQVDLGVGGGGKK